jgi:hypothetical protein
VRLLEYPESGPKVSETERDGGGSKKGGQRGGSIRATPAGGAPTSRRGRLPHLIRLPIAKWISIIGPQLFTGAKINDHMVSRNNPLPRTPSRRRLRRRQWPHLGSRESAKSISAFVCARREQLQAVPLLCKQNAVAFFALRYVRDYIYANYATGYCLPQLANKNPYCAHCCMQIKKPMCAFLIHSSTFRD